MTASVRALPPAILVMGPTASGKTDLALWLAGQLPCGIISVDSALVYRGMDIGTAKPSAEILRQVPHRLVDILDPAEPYSAARFRDDALREMAASRAAGRIPLLVGGTMLYFRALERGLAEMPAAAPEIRARLDAEMAALGSSALHGRLARLDPEAAARIHPNDPQRIQRALEVYEVTGMTLTELHARQAETAFPYRTIKLIVTPADRAELHQRIEQRFRVMLEQGFVEEVARLRARGDLNPDLPAMRAVGYRQVWEYLDGKMGYEEMVRRGVVATRQFAKRQLTWLRSEAGAVWFDACAPDLYHNILKYIEDGLNLVKKL